MAQRALALFMSLVLATTLTPSFSYADEVGATNNTPATENAANTMQAAGNAAAPAPSADAGTASISGDQQKQVVSSDEGANAANNAATATGTGSVKGKGSNAPTGQTGNNGTANGAPATQDSTTQAETVSATLKISAANGLNKSQAFKIEKGKTVEDLLNKAVEQKFIDAYTHGDPYTGYTAYYISSITINGIKYRPTSDTGFYWGSSINGSWDNTGLNETVIENDGFSYELNYTSWMTPEATKYPTTPDAQHPDKASGNDTTSYVKNTGNSSTVTSAPTSSDNAALAWKKQNGAGNYSELLTIGDSLFMASSAPNADWSYQPAILHRLNAKTGEEIASLQLFGAIDYTCRPVYTDGVIVIPLSNGRLQGVSATEMKTLWVSEAVSSGAQAISTVTATGGMVFTGTVNSFNKDYTSASGTFFGINAITGQRVWANEESTTGYYWAGACKVGNVLIYGNDAGVLSSVDPATGKVVSALKLSSGIRSSVISNAAETEAYVTTNDGKLHKIAVNINGSLTEVGAAAFSAYSTSTATLFEGNLFVGGSNSNYKGQLSVLDAATMQVKSSIELPFEVKSAPLVAKAADGKTYAYFTCNGAEGAYPNYTNGGGAWVYCLETNTATRLFDATGDAANYCTKSIVMGANGALYWTNDSGTLFALASTASSSSNNGSGSNSDNNKAPEKPETNNQQNNEASSSNTGGHAPAATPISAGNASAAAQAPLSDAEALAENEASSKDENGGAVTSASSARGTSSDNTNNSKGAPWLPIVGIVAGCAGLIAVGTFLFRRRSL